MDYPRERMNREGYGISKIVYLRALGAVIQSIREFRPDIVHAHYASSYGLLGALSRFHPYVLSVWGSDVFDFPRKSFMHRALLRYNFRAADRILSTSKIMVQEIGRYTHKTVQVTPFGIDLDQFKPASATRSGFRHGDIVIGTIKKMERIYGLEHLVRAFGIVKRNHPKLPLKLLLVGGGSLERSLKQLVRQLRLERETSFVGEVPISDIPLYHNMISIFASLSLSESFGVSVLEASACERPVVASCVGGLSEVVLHGKTGYLVPAHDSRGAAAALEKLILDSQLRTDMGRRGREFVRRNYNWSDSVAVMMDIYREFEEPPVLHQSNKAGRVL
jgi:glycosyltransferase involved in cell wall biosynthesis